MRWQDRTAFWITILIAVVMFTVKIYQGKRIHAQIRNS
jgi:hypothetical protein